MGHLQVWWVALAATVLGASCTASTGVGPGFVSHDAGADCGSRTGNPCGDGARCLVPGDCQSALCRSGLCVAPAPGCTDGQKNFAETDIDCGGPECPACAPGKDCLVAGDCSSDECSQRVCLAPSANDGVKNDSESDVDCGGRLQADGRPNAASDGAPACVPGNTCLLPSDCIDGVCDAKALTAGHTTGDTAGRDGGHAKGGGALYCQPASRGDGVRNGSETDVDCGGELLATGDRNPASDGAPPCGHDKACLVGTDCAERVCNDNHDKGGGPVDCPSGKTCTCQVPWANDGAHNDGETDVDCGGGGTLGSDGAPPCPSYLHCKVAADCQSLVCTAGLCAPPTPTDGTKNDSETDVDCGGATLGSGMPNTASDGAPGCRDDETCALDTDCLSGFCSVISHTCVDGQSCKGLVAAAKIMDPTGMTDKNGDAVGTPDPNGVGEHAGLDTCGVGESTDPPGSRHHESCCRSLLMPGSTTLRMDKYEVTAGRIRQFLKALNYDVEDWALAQFDANGNPITQAGNLLAAQLPVAGPGITGVTTNALTLLPHSNNTGEPLNAIIVTGALVLDTTGVQGCYTASGDGGAATYWWDAPTLATMAGSPPRPFTQDYYDIKPMNCIPYYVAAAFCAWDGGRLPLQPEHASVWGAALKPWGPAMLPNPYPGNQMITADPACAAGAVTCTVDWFNGGQAVGTQGNFYFYPSFPGNIPNNLVPDSLSNSLDLTPYIAAPGRFYLDATSAVSSSFGGNEPWQDLGADMIEWADTSALTGTEELCDESGVLGPGESYNCNCGIGGGCPGAAPFIGVTRGVNLPAPGILGGSWEGHTIAETQAPAWSFYRQYGKLGLRCVRPAE